VLNAFTNYRTLKPNTSLFGIGSIKMENNLDIQIRIVYSQKRIYKDQQMKDFINVMKAVSDPNRVKILKMLQNKSMCVCEMQEALQIAQPSVSKQLKLLENCGLITSRKDGLWVNYYLTDGSSSPYAAVVLGKLKHWLDDDPEISELLRRLPEIRREEICKR